MTRLVVLLGMLAALPGMSGAAAADTWPSRAVRIVCTFAPGGAADLVARLVAAHMSQTFGERFYVETRAGAAGAIGLNYVAHMPPDGYNYVVTTFALLVLDPLMDAKITYDPQKDLTNVAYMAGSPIVFVVNANSGIRTLRDFVALGKKSQTPLTYSSSGVGSNGQLIGEYFGKLAGIPVAHVPYKGASQGLTDLVGGNLVFSSQTLTSASALIRSGMLVPIALTAKTRLPVYPDVPTFKELGYPDLVTTMWFGLAGPPGLPQDIADKVNAEVIKAVSEPDAAKLLRQDGMVVNPLNVAQFAAFITAETARWRPMLEKAGFAAR